MSTLDCGALMDDIVSFALQLGVFESVNKHEPVGNIGTYVAAVLFQGMGPARGASGLDATSVRVEFVLQIYSNMIATPLDQIDPNIASATALVMNALSTNFSLGDTVREIDLLGEFGTPLSSKARYIQVSSALYRYMEITIPIIVDDVFQQVA